MRTELLIIGAGPFGLSLAAWANDASVEYLCVGTPMEFWRRNMPDGMLLRSGPDWHVDPTGACTIERFLALTPGSRTADTPLSRTEYLAYIAWLQQQHGIAPLAARVTRLTAKANGARGFLVELADGRRVDADSVAVAIGFGHFAHVPPELAAAVPAWCAAHTSELVDFASLAGRRCLIVGGRQSAFEWAALMHEAGAASVEIIHRHATPAFAVSHWEWVTPLVARLKSDPGWYRRLDDQERRAIDLRLWSEGRLKLEPWLAPRLAAASIRARPCCSLVSCQERSDGALDVTLSDGDTLVIDSVVFATGYKVRIDLVPFLRPLVERGDLRTRNGFPELDERFQSSMPGLYITSMPATQDFGPFLAFTVSAAASASVIGTAATAGRRRSAPS